MKKIVPIIFLLLIMTACLSNGQQEEYSETEFGEAVFYEIFPLLLDSIHTDHRIIPPPPSPEYFKFMDSAATIEEGFEEWKKSADYKKWLENFEKKKDSIKQDTTAIYLTLPDLIGRTEENDIKDLIDHFNNHNISIDSFIESKPFRIDLSKLKTNHSKIKFIYQSKLPGDGEFWKNDYDKYIAASLGFTKIIFDKNQNLRRIKCWLYYGSFKWIWGSNFHKEKRRWRLGG